MPIAAALLGDASEAVVCADEVWPRPTNEPTGTAITRRKNPECKPERSFLESHTRVRLVSGTVTLLL